MKTKLLLLTIACAFTIQVSAQSGDIKYEDFITDSLNITPGILDNGFRYYATHPEIRNWRRRKHPWHIALIKKNALL